MKQTLSPGIVNAQMPASAASVFGNQNQVNDSIQLQNIAIQTKLSVGAVDDPMEHEADAMADKVMRMPEQNFIQRKCADCEEEEKQLQRKPLASFIQKKQASPGNNVVASDSVSHQIDSTKGSGNAINETTKSFMEKRFETDFSNVRIHSNKKASQLSNQFFHRHFSMLQNHLLNKLPEIF